MLPTRPANFLPAPDARDPAAAHSAPSDVALVRQLVDGSEDALAHLYDRHADAVFRSALRVGRDPSIATDVVQDTFLALWDRADRFDPARGSLAAWLATIARNRTIDRLRALKREPAAAFSSFSRPDTDDSAVLEWLMATGDRVGVGGPEPSPDEVVVRTETQSVVRVALGSLPPIERTVIALAYGSGLSQSEIAERLGWPMGTVKTRTRRALRHLRDRLEPRLRGGDLAASVAVTPCVQPCP